MKVLVACEFSGTVRDEFLRLGHDAVSCDLLPTEKEGPHIQGDVLDVLKAERFDLMIAHPPCTYLTVAANRAFKEDPTRYQKREEAFRFAMSLYNADVPRVCMENPMGYLNTHFRRPDQIIHPWMFGDCEMKRTCLWLKKLPKLTWISNPTKPKRERECIRTETRFIGMIPVKKGEMPISKDGKQGQKHSRELHTRWRFSGEAMTNNISSKNTRAIKMTYNMTKDKFEATTLNIVYNLSQLAHTKPTEEIIEACKKAFMESGKINIIEDSKEVQ